MNPEYIYRGDRWTDPALRGATCSAVRRLNRTGRVKPGQPPTCIRGKNGNMLVRFSTGQLVVVLGRQLRKLPDGYIEADVTRYPAQSAATWAAADQPTRDAATAKAAELLDSTVRWEPDDV